MAREEISLGISLQKGNKTIIKLMKNIRFSDPLVPLVLSGEKTTTWRMWDDKNLKTGEEVLFVAGPERKPFAKAKLVKVYEKRFGEITDEDRFGHERYEDEQKTYTGFYGKDVTDKTPTKVVRFELLEKYKQV